MKTLKLQLEETRHQLAIAQREGNYEKASRLKFSTIPELERALERDQTPSVSDGSTPSMLHDRVTSDDIARVVAKTTGIPVASLLRGEKEKLVHVCICNISW